MFSKRHYVFIARVIPFLPDAGYRADIAQLFADAFENESAAFKRSVFLKACNVQPEDAPRIMPIVGKRNAG
jgi:hypothetical protein